MQRRTHLPISLATCALWSICACGDDTQSSPDAADAGPALPDARVVERFDAGPRDAEIIVEPTLNAVQPRSGSESGGTRVVLKGTAFSDPMTVRFGSEPATSVVVLDENTLSAVTPPGTPGIVGITVETAGGSAELPRAYTYVRDLLVFDITPTQIPEEGGVELEISGKGFDERTVILLDDKPLRGQRVASSERILGYAPSLHPGRPKITAVGPGVLSHRHDLLLVYATPDLLDLAPAYGPALTALPVEILGTGFEDLEEAHFGNAPAANLQPLDGTVRLSTPELEPGTYDLEIKNAFASAHLDDAFIAVGAGPSPELLGVVPGAISTAGGALRAVGRGIQGASQVKMQGQTFAVAETDAWSLLTQVSGLHAGTASISVLVDGSTLTANVRVFEPITLTSVTPTTAGTLDTVEVTIRGSGFTPDLEVRIGDVPLQSLQVINAHELRGTVVAGAYGPADIIARNRDSKAVAPGAFFFQDAFDVVFMTPPEGSMAGNTLITIYGRGFPPGLLTAFGDEPGVFPELVNGSVFRTRSPKASPGEVVLEFGSDRGSAKLDYSYYDPRVVTGGGWGGPIEGSVNVGVLDANSGNPIQGAVVQLGLDANLRYAGVTDENGVATISWPELVGPQTVTIGQNGLEHSTFVEVNTRNLTFYASPHPASPPPDAPPQPCPTGGEPPVIRGHVFKFKSSIDPNTRPGWIPIAQVTYTQSSVFSPNPPLPPGQIDYVFSDGEEYEILVARGGVVAVYALMGEYNQETMEFIPRRVGIRRQIPTADGSVVEDADIELDIDLDRKLDVRLDSPPRLQPGPGVNAVFPFVNLGSEGVIALPMSRVEGSDVVSFDNLPNAAGLDMLYMGGAYTNNGDSLSYPYSITLASSGDETITGLDIGPFLRLPEDISPKPGWAPENSQFSWRVPGTAPDVTTLLVLDGTSISGCCCVDLNQSGTCEATEDVMCASAPVQFQRWSVFGSGELMSYPMPAMPAGIQGLVPGTTYFYVVQQGIAPRFDWDEFIYNQFSPYFWRSWSVWVSQFTAREVTP